VRLASIEKEALQPYIPPTDPAAINSCISHHFYEAMQSTKKMLLDQKLYTAEEIADIMGESYHAMLDLSVLHLLKEQKSKQELLTLTGLLPDSALHKTLSALEAKFVHVSLLQRVKLDLLATHKDANAAKNETDPVIKELFSLIGTVRLEIGQNILNSAAGPNGTPYNFNDVFN